MEILVFVVTALLSYLLGSIPAGYLAGRAKGVDIRKLGSGNIGATNVSRVLGRKLGIFVLVIDGLKGWAGVTFVPALVLSWFSLTPGGTGPDLESLGIFAGVSAVLGHNYPCWLRFKGGKGIATSAGVVAALIPMALVISLSIWIVVCLLTRYVSVASIVAAFVLPFAAWGVGRSRLLISFAAVLGALAIYKHKANMQRLMQGTESKIGQKKQPPTAGAAQ